MPWLLLPEIFVKIFPDSFSPVSDSCQDNGSESGGVHSSEKDFLLY